MSEVASSKKHWLDWLAVGVSLFSLAISSLVAYHTVIVQRDDIRLVVGDALNVWQDESDLLLAKDQEFTFINSGNRQAVIHEIYGELVLVLDPNTGCKSQFAKSIILDPTQIVLKPGDILPLRAKVAQRYPWDEKDKDTFRFRQSKGELRSRYLVCLHLFVTTPDSTSVTWVQPLYSVQPNELPSELFSKDQPLKVLQRTRWSFG
jgi:hypothetical protein